MHGYSEAYVKEINDGWSQAIMEVARLRKALEEARAKLEAGTDVEYVINDISRALGTEGA